MGENSPTVSVILPTYNRAHLIGRAIESVLNQTYQDFELIVIDDGSTDNTQEVMKALKDKRVRNIRHSGNTGAAAARNRGIMESRGEYIAFQDSDDEWMPEKLRKQINVLNGSPPTVGYVYSDMWRISRDGRVKYRPSPSITQGQIIDKNTLDYQVFNLGIQTALIKRECFEKVGIFDEKFPRLIDLEFFVRLATHFHSYHIKEPLVRFYETDGISSNCKAYSIGRILLLKKHYNYIKKNKRFLSNQYFLISRNSYSYGDLVKGRKYLLKAIAVCPLYKEPLFFQFKIVFGDDAYVKLRKFCRKMKNLLRVRC